MKTYQEIIETLTQDDLELIVYSLNTLNNDTFKKLETNNLGIIEKMVEENTFKLTKELIIRLTPAI